MIANLRFKKSATIDRHSAPFEIDVVCIAGTGFTSVGESVSVISAGEFVRWPKGEEHCLWTTDPEMETLMVERHSSG